MSTRQRISLVQHSAMLLAVAIPFIPYAVLRFRTEHTTMRNEIVALALLAWCFQLLALSCFFRHSRSATVCAILNLIAGLFVPAQLFLYEQAIFPLQSTLGVVWGFAAIIVPLSVWMWLNTRLFRGITLTEVYLATVSIESVTAAVLFLRWIAGYR